MILIEKCPMSWHLGRRKAFMFSSFLILLDVNGSLVSDPSRLSEEKRMLIGSVVATCVCPIEKRQSFF